MDILKELFYSDLNPNSYLKSQSDYEKFLEIVAKNEEILTQLLDGTEKKLFLEFANAHSAINGETAVSNFVSGFKLGAKFMQEINN